MSELHRQWERQAGIRRALEGIAVEGTVRFLGNFDDLDVQFQHARTGKGVRQRIAVEVADDPEARTRWALDVDSMARLYEALDKSDQHYQENPDG